MSTTKSRLLGERSIERVRALSDGVFAFAMTVLVLDLHLPEASSHRTSAEFLAVLAAHKYHFLSFVLSFVVLAMYWIAHHNTFILIVRSSRTLIVANLAFLLCIVLVPFAASFLGQDGSAQAAVIAYGVVLTLTSLVLALLVVYMFRTEGLVDRTLVPTGLRREALQRILLPVAIYLLSMGVSFASVELSVAIYVVLPLVFLLPSRVDHWAE